MKVLIPSPLKWWKQSPFRLRAQVIGLLLLFTVLLAVCCASGCATTTEGVAREERIYNIATNAVARAQAVAPSLPQPIGSATEAVLAMIGLGLGAWNTIQHRQIKSLQNGKSINGTSLGNGTSPPST